MTQTIDKLMTAEELLRLGPDFHGELVRGRLVEMAPASWGHGDIALTVGSILHRFVRSRNLGRVFAAETGFRLSRDPDSVRAPDVAFVAQHRIPQTDDRSGYFEGAPDLAVEIVSPNDSYGQLAEKVADYLAAGSRLVWVIDPSTRTVTIHRANGSTVLLRSHETLSGDDVLPGFTTPVAAFFE